MVWWASPCVEQVVRFPHVVPTANSRFRLWWSVVASHVQRVRVHLGIPCQPGLDVLANPTLLMRVLALPMRGSHVHEGVLLRSKLQQKQARRAYGPSWNECVFHFSFVVKDWGSYGLPALCPPCSRWVFNHLLKDRIVDVIPSYSIDHGCAQSVPLGQR